MRADLLVNRDILAPDVEKLGDKLVRIGDHQVCIEWQFAERLQGPDNGRSVREIRHEVAVHDVEMYPVRAAALGGAHRLTEIARVGRQDRW
jgi:hypothetical protein